MELWEGACTCMRHWRFIHSSVRYFWRRVHMHCRRAYPLPVWAFESAGCVRLCVLNMQAARLLPAHCTTERHVLRALSRGCSLRSAVQSIPFGSMYTQSYSAAVFNEAASVRLRSLDACRAVIVSCFPVRACLRMCACVRSCFVLVCTAALGCQCEHDIAAVRLSKFMRFHRWPATSF